MTIFVEVDGVMWCAEHQGLVDECSSRVDDVGETVCDQWDGNEPNACRFLTLYTEIEVPDVCEQCRGVGHLGPATNSPQSDYGKACPTCCAGRECRQATAPEEG